MKSARYEIRGARYAFSLVEVVTALFILAFICSTVLTIYNRCIISATDSTLKIHALEVARGNMEALLSRDSVQQMTEYGQSDKYPEIEWQTAVETFYEPLTSRMWVQAICSAQYIDSADQQQSVELTHWLTNLSKEDVLKILEQQEKEKEQLAEMTEAEQRESPEQLETTDKEELEELLIDLDKIPEELREAARQLLEAE